MRELLEINEKQLLSLDHQLRSKVHRNKSIQTVSKASASGYRNIPSILLRAVKIHEFRFSGSQTRRTRRKERTHVTLNNFCLEQHDAYFAAVHRKVRVNLCAKDVACLNFGTFSEL